MWTETTEGKAFIQEISKRIITEISPEELDLFEELIDEFFQNPIPAVNSEQNKDDLLGFGIDEIIIALTPATAAMVIAAINYISTQIIEITKESSAKTVKKRISELFKKKGGEEISKEQMRTIKKIAKQQAVEFGISPGKAEKMAKALIGSLTLK